jgi:hypothetical protein
MFIDTLKEENYGLDSHLGNTLYRNCHYFHDSWIYRQSGMDNCKVDYYHCCYPRHNFPDHKQARHIKFPAFKKNQDKLSGTEAIKKGAVLD